MEIIDIITEVEKEEQKALRNNQNEPNPNLPKEDEKLDLSPDLPVANFMPEQPIMLEQKIDIIVTVVLNDPKIEKTVQVINTAVKNRKVTGVVYAVSDITNVDVFKAALEAQRQLQNQNSEEEFKEEAPKEEKQKTPEKEPEKTSSEEPEEVVEK